MPSQILLNQTRFDLQNRGKLFSFKQTGNVPAAKFLQEIRELYAVINYPDAVAKETLIRDLFISGIASVEAKLLLFQQDIDTLSTDKCLLLVSSFESVRSTCSTSDSATVGIEVSAVRQHESQPPTIAKAHCHGCGQQPLQHSRKNCQAYKLFCWTCGKLGHFSKVCRKAVVNTTQEVDNSDTHQISISSVKMSGQRRRSISLSINGKRLNILIDSGSDLTIVNVRTAKRLCLRLNPPPFPVPKIAGSQWNSY